MTEAELLDRVRDYTNEAIIPSAREFDARDEFPAHLVDGLRDLGLFGLTIDPEYGGLGMGLDTYSRAVEEIARGWMSVAGILNTHFIVAWMVGRHGTREQKARLLPRLADGSLRAAFSMSEPHCGSDLAAIRTTATPAADGWSVSGKKR
jgi:alkylation response protein AidB-like acyl-CoA dehydrogenase